MNRPVMIHVLLLGLALVAAYFVWTREPDKTEEEVTILSIRSGLDRVIYATADRTVEISRRKDATGPYHWVKVETLEEPPKPPKPPKPKTPAKTDGGAKPADGGANPAAKTSADAGVSPAPGDGGGERAPAPEPTAPPKIRKVKQFKGNNSLDELMESLAQLSAVRSLGVVEKDKLEQFGLDGSKNVLTLVSGSTPRTFIVGKKTFGSMNTYVQDKADRRVYILRPRLTQDFQYAEFRLVDRELYGFGPTEMDRAVFKTKTATKVLIQKNRRDPAAAQWVDQTAPDRRKDLYKNWMGRLNRLRTLEFVQPDKKPKDLVELFSAEFFLGAKRLGQIRWYQGPPAAQEAPKPLQPPGKEGPATDHYVESQHTRGLVTISRTLGEEVARDLASLMQD